MQTHAEVQEIARQVYAELTAKYSDLQPPKLRFVEVLPDREPSGYVSAWFENRAGTVQIVTSEFLHPETTATDVAWVVAHEMGHWHQHQTMGGMLYGLLTMRKDSELYAIASHVDDEGFLHAYRETEVEAYADRFAVTHGYGTDIWRALPYMREARARAAEAVQF